MAFFISFDFLIVKSSLAKCLEVKKIANRLVMAISNAAICMYPHLDVCVVPFPLLDPPYNPTTIQVKGR